MLFESCMLLLQSPLPPEKEKTSPCTTTSLFFSGFSDLQGCGCGLLTGGVVVPGLCSEEPVQGRDVGELQQLPLSG